MLLYHATHMKNLETIGKEGVSTAYSESAFASVWGCEWSMRHWAMVHCVRRHGGLVEHVRVLEIDTQDVPAHRFRGGLFYSLHTWHPSQIKRVITFDELSGSPTEEE